MNQARRDIIMKGNGINTFEIPTGMNYVAVLNNTDNTVEVYQKQVTESNLADALIEVVPYQNITIPIRQGQGQQFTVIYTDGGIVNEKRVSLIFADVNLNINAQTGTAGGSSNVTIVSESIGLARQAQLPAALTGGGNFKTEIMNTVPVSIGGAVEISNDSGNPIPVSSTQLPAALTGDGALRTSGNSGFAGLQANAWNGTAVGVNGVSTNSPDLWYATLVSIYGNVSAATDIIVQLSANGTTFYDSEIKITMAAAGNFGKTFDCAARYVRLKSSAAATITATITAK